ncbi:S8 family peptidase [[Clostridium] polysaccharolyticum]|uniref:Serine protease AprX n=1 Tax=[Clostridium] polysaccharolyticum TaxID=29364 RepID=A0A1H9YN73_9FIRM|nr:S8 family peptidase [[Clostridium] polysaccharolyticum]SES70424.1 serine protease AprX [[Clostridium] polysaccharolyticum]
MERVSDIIHLKAAHSQNILGQDIGVAVLDTGIIPHPDFVSVKNRIIAFQDFVNGSSKMYDDNGHGTHVSGILAGDGFASRGMYCGVAPACNIISVKVLNQKGNGDINNVVAGLRWVVQNKERYNIRIVNISVGTTAKSVISEDSELVKAVDMVWDNNIVVVVAAGNGGPHPKTIGAPGISRKVITVGASDDDIAVDLMGKSTKDYSGRGPTSACIKKPDVVAPGSRIISCNAMKRQNPLFGFSKGNMSYYTEKSGTSMSTPLVSGAAALMLSKHPEYTTRDVKLKLRECSDDLGQPHGKQGWGRLNIERLLG